MRAPIERVATCIANKHTFPCCLLHDPATRGQGGDTTGAKKRTHTRLPRRPYETHCANAHACQRHADRTTELLTSYRFMVWLGNLLACTVFIVSASAAHGETGLRVLIPRVELMYVRTYVAQEPARPSQGSSTVSPPYQSERSITIESTGEEAQHDRAV